MRATSPTLERLRQTVMQTVLQLLQYSNVDSVVWMKLYGQLWPVKEDDDHPTVPYLLISAYNPILSIDFLHASCRI